KQLALAGSWASRPTLDDALQAFGTFVVDNTLAELVEQQLVMFNPRGREYRLAGERLARQALQRLHAEGQQRVMLSKQDKQHYRVGLARRISEDSDEAVMAELELPYPKDVAGVMALAQQLNTWVAP
ncbi:MAG: hypothetical protein C0423_14035, partial [Methylibium sp.]|nr:hypothetical protein [Methylibium sp.]